MRLRSIRLSGLLRSKGFSLIEVMVAMAIMSIAVVAVFQLFSVALRSTKKTEDFTKALLYARSMLDEIYSVSDPEEAAGIKEFEGKYTVSKEVVLHSESENKKAKLYEITVTVTWPPKGNLKIKGSRSVYDPAK